MVPSGSYYSVKRFHNKQQKRVQPFLDWFALGLAANGTLVDMDTCSKCGNALSDDYVDAPGKLNWVLSKRFDKKIVARMCKSCAETA